MIISMFWLKSFRPFWSSCCRQAEQAININNKKKIIIKNNQKFNYNLRSITKLIKRNKETKKKKRKREERKKERKKRKKINNKERKESK